MHIRYCFPSFHSASLHITPSTLFPSISSSEESRHPKRTVKQDKHDTKGQDKSSHNEASQRNPWRGRESQEQERSWDRPAPLLEVSQKHPAKRRPFTCSFSLWQPMWILLNWLGVPCSPGTLNSLWLLHYYLALFWGIRWSQRERTLWRTPIWRLSV